MHMLIPVEMCRYAISNKFIRPLQLYVYLKTQHVGCFKLDVCFLKKIADDIGLKSVKMDIPDYVDPTQRYQFAAIKVA